VDSLLLPKRQPGVVVARLGKRLRSLLASRAARRHALVGSIRHWKSRREFQISFLKRAGLRPDQHLLDIGCGTLRGGLPIIAHLDPGHYYGIEVRADVLAEGRKELHEARLEWKRPVLRVEPELSPLDLGRTFDVIWAFSVLIHLTDERLEDCFRLVASHLADGGVFYATVNLAPPHDGTWREFPLVFRPFEFYADVAARHGLATKDFGRTEDLGVASEDPKIRAAQHMLRFER